MISHSAQSIAFLLAFDDLIHAFIFVLTVSGDSSSPTSFFEKKASSLSIEPMVSPVMNGVVVALSNSAVKYADLDGYNNIKEDPVTEGILMSKGEVRLSSDLPGTGISVKEKFLKV